MTQKIRIVGGAPLTGSILISGAKNATLPLMAASLLTSEPLHLHNVPRVADVILMGELLQTLGVNVNMGGDHTITLKASDIYQTVAPYELVSRMRASFVVLGPLLARCGQAKISLPGGCAIGTRPVDIHLEGLRQLGAEIEVEEGYVHAYAANGLVGKDIALPLASVTATKNLMMAACLARGETRLINAAREPEVIDLAVCLTSMGAQIDGAGTDVIVIQGVDRLLGTTHRVISDRIEAGTYAMAAVMTGGALDLVGAFPEHLKSLTTTLERAGADVLPSQNGLYVAAPCIPIQGVDIMTEPFPGFATDLQAQFMALMCICHGAAMITETIFENRFMHVPELCRMGANISVHRSSALIRGVRKLSGAPVMATDLRASVSLVLAGLVAEGETILDRVYHLDRGYENLEAKLQACGALIERVA